MMTVTKMAAIFRWQPAWLLVLFAATATDAFQGSIPGTTCQAGEVDHGGVCYGLTSDEPRGFNTARLQLSDSGDLPRVASAALNAKLLALLATSGAQSAYIGLTDQFTEGDFKWTVGVPLLSSDYENWASAGKGSPNHEDVRDCVVMSRITGKWSAINCNDDRAYFYDVGAVSGSKLSF